MYIEQRSNTVTATLSCVCGGEPRSGVSCPAYGSVREARKAGVGVNMMHVSGEHRAVSR